MHELSFIVFQQIEIDTIQGEVYDGLNLPFRPLNVPIMRLYGVTRVFIKPDIGISLQLW